MEETRAFVTRSELWDRIYSVVKKLKLANNGGDYDSMDHPSCATELEYLFKKRTQEKAILFAEFLADNRWIHKQSSHEWYRVTMFGSDFVKDEVKTSDELYNSTEFEVYFEQMNNLK